jgi:hypothetical protein
MRTQLILTTAVLGVAGSLGASAQVYSVNAVGYINLPVPADKLVLIANQLKTANNTLPEVLPVVPDGTQIFKLGATGFQGYGYEGEWDVTTVTLPPGEGFFLKSPTATTITLVGEVPQGPLSTALKAGLNLVASQVPQAGGIQSVLGYTPADGDQVYKWDITFQTYVSFGYEGEWSGPVATPPIAPEPALAVGEGVFINKLAAGTWSRTFSVN